MIQLLFTFLFAEGAVALLLMAKTPLRRVLVKILDLSKRGMGPAVGKTIAATVSVLLASSLASIWKIRNRSIAIGNITPTDQVLMSKNALEASLMGYIIFLALVIDRLHHYLRELRQLKKNMEPLKKQPRISEDEYLRLKDEAKNSSDVINSLKEELSDLREKVKKMGAEFEAKEGEAKAAEANALSLKKQSEGLLLEYDRLLEDNQNLRSQLQTMERNVSRSDIKRDV